MYLFHWTLQTATQIPSRSSVWLSKFFGPRLPGLNARGNSSGDFCSLQTALGVAAETIPAQANQCACLTSSRAIPLKDGSFDFNAHSNLTLCW